MVEIICGIAVGVLILVLAVKFEQRKEIQLSDKTCTILLLILFAAFAFLITYKVTEIPIPYNVDEAGMAYDAKSLANYHVDRYLYHFPVYLVNFGGGQSALYAYLTAALIKLFGFSVLIVRLPAILLSLLSALVFTLTVRREKGNLASVTAMAFFCILPFSIMHSRWGLDAYLLFPMMIFSVCAFYHAIQTAKIRWYFLSGILFGMTLYAYVISYLIIPVFFGITLIYLLVIKKICWKNIIVMGIPLFLFALPLMLMLAVNNGMIADVNLPYISIPHLNGFRSGEVGFHNVLTNLKLDDYNIFYEIFANDHCQYNVNPRFGTIYYLSIPLLIYGLLLCVRGNKACLGLKTMSLDLLMIMLFIASFSVAFFVERPNVNRSCVVYIPLIYFLVIGFLEILRKNRWVTAMAVCCYMLCFGLFIHYYFHDFAKDLEHDYLFARITDLEEALEFTETVYQNDETVYVLGRSNPYIYTILALDVDPYTFDENKVLSYDGYVKQYGKYRFQLDAVMPECYYIFRDLNDIPEEINDYPEFSNKQFGSVIVYYPNPEH